MKREITISEWDAAVLILEEAARRLQITERMMGEVKPVRGPDGKIKEFRVTFRDVV